MYIDAYDFSYFMAWPLFLAASGINCLFLSELCVCRCCCPCIYFYDPKCWHVEPEPEPASIPSNTITNINVIYVLDTFGGKRRLDLGGMRESRRGDPWNGAKKNIYTQVVVEREILSWSAIQKPHRIEDLWSGRGRGRGRGRGIGRGINNYTCTWNAHSQRHNQDISRMHTVSLHARIQVYLNP